MYKFIVILFLITVSSYGAEALQCEAMPDKEIISRVTDVFTAKIITKTDEAAQISVVKAYKGEINGQVQLTFTSVKMAKSYKLMDEFKVGEIFLFATSGVNVSNPKIVKLGICGFRKNINSAKSTIDWLESSTAKNKK